MLAETQWALIFGAARRRGASWPDMAAVAAFKREVETALAALPAPAIVVDKPKGRQVGQRGIALIHSFETCKLDAYKDPGSVNGLPITIGWGSTRDRHGNPITLGTRWTQEECDFVFALDLGKTAAEVERLIGDAFTDQSMFDAMVSLAYNIGTGKKGFGGSTVLRRHKAGDHAGAAAAFAWWNKNDGRVMRGLVRRRAAEAALYLADG